MKRIWAVYSYSGSMLTPNLVLKEMDAEGASTAASVASPYGEPHAIVDDLSRETNESRPASVLDPKQFAAAAEGGDPPHR
ncbi:MAG: hypothetical protein ACREYF_22325 [Gammaproteobacteria bacterium]